MKAVGEQGQVENHHKQTLVCHACPLTQGVRCAQVSIVDKTQGEEESVLGEGSSAQALRRSQAKGKGDGAVLEVGQAKAEAEMFHTSQGAVQGGLHAALESSATCMDEECRHVAIKLVNFGLLQREVVVQLKDPRGLQGLHGARSGAGRKWLYGRSKPAQSQVEGLLISLSARDPQRDTNSVHHPDMVAPYVQTIQVFSQTRLSLPPFSLSVLVIGGDSNDTA